MERSIDGITEYTASNTSRQMAARAEQLSRERAGIIERLACTRKSLFKALNQEYESIVICGESTSPAEAARFVADNAESLERIIPGEVALRAPFPLSDAELVDLYRSNSGLEAIDEAELDKSLPDPSTLLDPTAFGELCASLESAESSLEGILSQNGWSAAGEGASLSVKTGEGPIALELDSIGGTDDLARRLAESSRAEPWQAAVAAQGRRGGAIADHWNTLFDQIDAATRASEEDLEKTFGYEIEYDSSLGFAQLIELLGAAKARLESCGTLEPQKRGLFSRLRQKEEPDFLAVRVDGGLIKDEKALDAARARIIAQDERAKCGRLWNQLATSCGLPSFEELDPVEPERAASRRVPLIKNSLSWYREELPQLLMAADAAGLGASGLFAENPIHTDLEAVEHAFRFTGAFLPALLELALCAQRSLRAQRRLDALRAVLEEGPRLGSALCRELAGAVAGRDAAAYKRAYWSLQATFDKGSLLESRRALLERIAGVAPSWAGAVESRTGIHGLPTPPGNVREAWLWRQYDGILREICSTSVAELQNAATELAQRYREKTAELAEARAWGYLLAKTERDISLKQALVGWKETVKRIGRGTGKRAPKYRKQARTLMASCQEAVPAWIMPMSRALSTLDPRSNKFDIVIVDEASQSDVTALAVAYMAKKLVVVGDDKQVSPLAVGVEIAAEDALSEIHLKGIIPNAHLYGSKLSLYDVALQTFQPLMLKEHFRCVPDIIGYSNKLSYDYKIKPLRDASSSNLLPAVVPHRVDGASRDLTRKVNYGEAEEIVRLIQACAAEPEYEGKTFGVISMLGNEQVKVLQQVALRELDPQLKEERKILIGDAANFQGDERDVIFLSMVDSARTPGAPMNLVGPGADDRTKKRYNVAASRAKDQLWVVYSMDPDSELKPGDIRKGLIDYARCPSAFQKLADEVEARAESPFEAAVGKALVARGYRVSQQWEVGAYRIDMVAHDDDGKVAIECDGERWHSGEDAICADMERQAILERLGWRFVRIRGSEYYRNPDKTIERVVEELSAFGLKPAEAVDAAEAAGKAVSSDLLDRVRRRVWEMREQGSSPEVRERRDAVEAALSGSPSHVGAMRGDDTAPSNTSAPGRPSFDEPRSARPAEENAAAGSPSSGALKKPAADRDVENACKANNPRESADKNAVGRSEEEGRANLQARAEEILREIDARNAERTSSKDRGKDEKPAQKESAQTVKEPPGKANVGPSTVTAKAYEKANVPFTMLSSSGYVSSQYTTLIARRMTQILNAEAPIDKQKLFNDVRECFGIGRSGSEIQRRNQEILDRHVPHKTTTWNGREYIWRKGQKPNDYALYRPNSQQCSREATELPYEEIRAAVLMALRGKGACPREELVKASAKRFGYKRVKARITEIFDAAIGRMIKEGLLT
ncbi:MAG: AAA domain-containing protein, partial [Coriobacteriales bacterium]